MSQSVNRLNEECNLVIAATHTVDVRSGDSVIFITDTEFSFGDDVPYPSLEAIQTAEDSRNSHDGCLGCGLRRECNSTAVVIRKTENGDLIPALRTSFIGQDTRRL